MTEPRNDVNEPYVSDRGETTPGDGMVPVGFAFAGDLQRRLDPLRDVMDPTTFASAYGKVTFGRLTTVEKMAVLTAEGTVARENAAQPPEDDETA